MILNSAKLFKWFTNKVLSIYFPSVIPKYTQHYENKKYIMCRRIYIRINPLQLSLFILKFSSNYCVFKFNSKILFTPCLGKSSHSISYYSKSFNFLILQIISFHSIFFQQFFFQLSKSLYSIFKSQQFISP